MIETREKATRVYVNEITNRQTYTPVSIKYADVVYYEQYAGNQVESPEDRTFTVVFLNNGDNLVLDVEYEEFDERCNAYEQKMFELYEQEILNKVK